jgi:hypothetical protein
MVPWQKNGFLSNKIISSQKEMVPFKGNDFGLTKFFPLKRK